MIQARTARRVFIYNGVSLGDPDPSRSPEEAVRIIAHDRPELLTAAIEGPTVVGNELQFTLVRAVREKG